MIIQLILVAFCVYFSIVDWKHRIIPSRMTHPLLFILCIWRLFEPSFFMGLIPAILFALMYVFNPSSIGEGDIKLFAIIGLTLGLEALLTVCLVTFVLLFCKAVWIKCIQRQPAYQIAAAPYITVGVLFVVGGQSLLSLTASV